MDGKSMTRLTCIALALVAVLPSTFAFAQQTPLAAQIDAAIAPHYKADEPGSTVIVTRDGKVVFRKAYGMASLEKKTPLTPDSVLRLGSITKQFTATAILMLAEEGKLSVKDEITKFLPDYPVKGKKVTVEQLLQHTSGIKSYTNKPDFMSNAHKDFTVAQMIDGFKNDPFDFEPGTSYNYNNSGYILLGAIIEKVSGMPYAKFLEQRIFVPLKMDNTAYEGHERGKAPRASGYARRGEEFKPAMALSMSQPYAAGSLVSNVVDLARWDQAISSGKLLKAASWQQAFTGAVLPNGQPTHYGYGWGEGEVRGAKTIGHGGGIFGFSTYAFRVPSEKLYVAVLNNADSGKVAPEVVARKAAAIALGKPYPVLAPVPVDAAALADYQGEYRIDEKGDVIRSFRVEEGKLVMQRTDRPPVKVLAYGKDKFFIEDSLVYMEFKRDAQGKVNAVTVSQMDTDQTSPRIGDVKVVAAPVFRELPAAVLDSYVGRYELAPTFMIDITRDGSNLYGQATGQPRFNLQATSDTEFHVREVQAKVSFEKNADGSIKGMVLNQGGRMIPGKRLP
jgi:CubicO group peptidase (beta-lactamase class C family)